MLSPLSFELHSQIVDNKLWKDYMRQILVKQNEFRIIQIINKFWGNTDFNEVVAQICESPINPSLNQFTLGLDRISLNSFHRVTAFLSDHCKFLTSLNLSSTCLGDQSVSFIVKAEWRYIFYFGFNANNLTSKGVKQLTKCEWKFISWVELMDNPLKNKGIKQLIRLHWKGLRKLNITNVGLTDDGAKILVRAQWPKLFSIELEKNQFTLEGVSHIFCANNWEKLIFVGCNQRYDKYQLKENLIVVIALNRCDGRWCEE